MTRLAACALLLSTAVAAQAADDAVKPILDLYRANKLFDKTEYKAVRAAAAKVFETRNAEFIKDAFGPDYESLSAWLEKQKDLKEELYSAIEPRKDDVSRVLAIFHDLWKDNPDAVAKYPNLAIAISVVWDQPRHVYDYRGHQRRTKSNLPEGYLEFGPLQEFRYHVSHAKEVQGKEPFNRLEVLPYEFLAFVVDHRTPVGEREWAIKNYLAKRPGFNYAPFGDLEAASRAIDAETIGIMIEPIQGEGGINLPPSGYLEGLRDLCDRHKLLLIFDEVQTGMGRTGKWYTHQHWNVKPDVITLAKAVAGGVALGGMLARPDVAEKLKPGTHAATFGGNPIACRAALATIETIEQDGLLDRAYRIGETFRNRFEAMKAKSSHIQEVRTKGAMIGVQLATDGAPVVAECLKRRLLVNCTHQTVIRLLPALNISDDQMREGLSILEEVLLSLK